MARYTWSISCDPFDALGMLDTALGLRLGAVSGGERIFRNKDNFLAVRSHLGPEFVKHKGCRYVLQQKWEQGFDF